MEVSVFCKVCAVPPRTLARGLNCRPRCIPGLISADIGHEAVFCRLARVCSRLRRSCSAGQRLALWRTAWGKFRFSPLPFPASPSAKGRLRSPCWNPIDQDREMLALPLDRPFNQRVRRALDPKPRSGVDHAPTRLRRFGREGTTTQERRPWTRYIARPFHGGSTW